MKRQNVLASKATFLLGVGAQKAGTSWLHDQLQRRNDVDFGFLKEYHVFDALELERFASFRPKRPSPLKWRTWRRARFIANPERYFDYFASRLKPDRIRLTGDITPSYAGLSTESYRRIEQAFAQRGVQTRAVFIMRDPVERFLSQQRMQLRKRGLLTPAHEIEHLAKASRKLLKRESPRNDYPEPSMPCGGDSLNHRSSSASTKPCSQQRHIGSCAGISASRSRSPI